MGWHAQNIDNYQAGQSVQHCYYSIMLQYMMSILQGCKYMQYSMVNQDKMLMSCRVV